MTEDQIVRLETALSKFESLVIRLENIKTLKITDKRAFKFDMDVLNKAFVVEMKKALNNLKISNTLTY